MIGVQKRDREQEKNKNSSIEDGSPSIQLCKFVKNQENENYENLQLTDSIQVSTMKTVPGRREDFGTNLVVSSLDDDTGATNILHHNLPVDTIRGDVSTLHASVPISTMVQEHPNIIFSTGVESTPSLKKRKIEKIDSTPIESGRVEVDVNNYFDVHETFEFDPDDYSETSCIHEVVNSKLV